LAGSKMGRRGKFGVGKLREREYCQMRILSLFSLLFILHFS